MCGQLETIDQQAPQHLADLLWSPGAADLCVDVEVLIIEPFWSTDEPKAGGVLRNTERKGNQCAERTVGREKPPSRRRPNRSPQVTRVVDLYGRGFKR